MNYRRLQRVSRGKTITFGCIFLILCVAFLVIFQLWRITNNPQIKQDKSVIKQVYIKFEHSIRHDDFTQAYTLMSPSYRERKNLESFTLRFRGLQRVDDRLEPQHFISIRGNTAWLYPKGSSQRHGASYEFEKINAKWYLTGRMSVIQD